MKQHSFWLLGKVVFRFKIAKLIKIVCWKLELLKQFIYTGHQAVADFLIRNGANVNIKSKYHDTALTWAAEKGKFQIAI